MKLLKVFLITWKRNKLSMNAILFNFYFICTSQQQFIPTMLSLITFPRVIPNMYLIFIIFRVMLLEASIKNS